MLLDEKDLTAFKNKGERTIFSEILSSYYSRNYRSAIVSLYALVIYDLYLKLNEMDEQGNKSAKNKLKEIEKDVIDNKHYSDIEKGIIGYYKENYSNYFNKFSIDIDYLTELRHKCAHLYLSDNELFVPSQNQTKMLVESMFNNLFRIEAPFIDDLFSLIKDEIEDYNQKIFLYTNDPKGIREKLNRKYYERMTDVSISKTINTLFRLLLVSKDEEAKKKSDGIFIFLDTLLCFAKTRGKVATLDYSKIENYIINKIEYDQLSDAEWGYIIYLGNYYPELLKIYNQKEGLTDSIKTKIKNKAKNIMKYYNYFNEEELVDIFVNRKIIVVYDQDYYDLYNFYVVNHRITIDDFFDVAFKMIGNFNSYSTADVVSSMFEANIDSISEGTLSSILTTYNGNKQCYNRSGHEEFAKIIIDRKNNYTQIDFTKYKHIFTSEV